MNTKIKITKKINPKKTILLVGLPGIGLVGKIAIDYLIKQTKATKIGEIYSDSFPPSIQTRNSIIKMINDEIYYLKTEENDFLFIAGPVQPTLDFKVGSSQEHYEFAETIIEKLKDYNISEIYTLAGINIGDERIEKKPEIIVAGTNKKIIEETTKYGAKQDKKEGLISGIAGLLIGIGKMNGIEGACLMGETNSRLVYGDHGAAKKVLDLIIKKFNLKIDMKGIDKETKNIEKAFQELSKKIQETQEKQEEGKPTYVR